MNCCNEFDHKYIERAKFWPPKWRNNLGLMPQCVAVFEDKSIPYYLRGTNFRGYILIFANFAIFAKLNRPKTKNCTSNI